MVESRRILVAFFLLLITASVTTQRQSLYFVVTDVDDITLPCENVIIDNSQSCDGTMWLFADSSGKRIEVLVRRGQIDERAKAKRDRLSVTANCSLVVKKVTDEDAGCYTCRRFESGQEDSQVTLSLVNMTEHRSHDQVTLSCSVATSGRCIHAVRWLLQGQRVDGGNTNTSTFQSGCWTNVTVSTSRFRDASKKKESWTCEVTDGFTREVHLFPFSSAESSGETTAVTGQSSSVTTRAGDEVSLPCSNVIDDQDRCDATTWISSRFFGNTASELIKLGQINNRISKSTSDRLSVAADCSLVIRNVTVEDAGQYSCRQYRSGQQQGGDAFVILSVVTITEDTMNGTVFFFCSVSTYDEVCSHTVEWLYGGKNTNLEILTSPCSARVGFSTQSKIQGLRCSVTDTRSGNMLLYHVGPPSKTAEPSVSGWLRFIVVSVGLAALIISVVAVNVWVRRKEQKTQTEENAVRYDGGDETVNYENIGPPDEVPPRHTC